MLKKLTSLTLVASLILGQSVMAQEKDGPFGIYMGMPKEDVIGILHDSVTQTEDEFSLRINPPRPHEAYGWYVVGVGEKAGVCSLQASSVEHIWPGPARYRPVSRDFIDITMDQLVGKFGKPTAFQGGKPPWGTTIWELEDTSEYIRRIKFSAGAHGEDLSEFGLNVVFEFENFELCEDEHWASTFRQIEEQENK